MLGFPRAQLPGMFRRCATPDPGRFRCSHLTLSDLLLDANGIKDYQLSGPAWMKDQSFDITAKVPAGATKEQTRQMLQRLLTDRFQLTLHRETRDTAVYALEVAPGGPKLKESDYVPPQTTQPPDPDRARKLVQEQVEAMRNGGPPQPPKPGHLNWSTNNGVNRIAGSGQTIARLVETLSEQLDHPVVDQTGLTGKYDDSIEFASMNAPAAIAPVPGAAPDGALPEVASAPSVFKAIQKLGLKLEPKKSQVEILVVDQAEKKPAEN